MFKRLKLAVIVCWLMFSTQAAHAILIETDATFLGGTTWEITYNVTNDGVDPAIDWFSIFYEYGLFENLDAASESTDWFADVYQPFLSGGVFPLDGIVDFIYTGSFDGLALGESLGGFTVQFDYLGDDTPFSLFVEVPDIDPLTGDFALDPLDSGETSQITLNNTAVPEPETLTLLLVAVGFLLRGRLHK